LPIRKKALTSQKKSIMRNLINLLFLICFASFAFSCKSSKTPKKTDETSNIGHKKVVNVEDFTFLAIKTKLTLDDAKNSMNFKSPIDIHLQKDSAIWLSARPMLGIEAMRMLLKPDSVFAIDRINKVFYAYSYETLSQKVNFDLNFKMLQSILLGNLPQIKGNWKEENENGEYLNLSTQTDNLFCQTKILTKTGRVEMVNAKDKQENHLNLTYQNFELISNKKMAKFLKAILHTKNFGEKPALQVELEHHKIDFPKEKPAFHFVIPTNFEKK